MLGNANNQPLLALFSCALILVSISGCATSEVELSAFSSTDQMVETLLENQIPCYDPDSSPNNNMNARELVCHDSKGDAYWIYLFDTREAMMSRLFGEEGCEAASALGRRYGENWYFDGGMGSESIGAEGITTALGGRFGTELEMLGCGLEK